MKYLVSACLLGHCCKYDGKNNLNEDLLNFLADKIYYSVCPEVYGSLLTPRLPCEQLGDRVIRIDGVDVSEQFLFGATTALEIAKRFHADVAILKARSPSCGKGFVYDGTFSHQLIPGHGVFAKLCLDAGIKVYSEEELDKLEEEIL